MAKIDELFPHLALLNQPCDTLENDDTSISEEDLFDVDDQNLESSIEVNTTPVAPVVTEETIDQVIHAMRLAECPPAQEPTMQTESVVSKEEFVAVLHRLEKENTWHEKRQAKKIKAGGKKKSRRNNKAKKASSSGGLKQRSTNQTVLPLGTRVPLSSRN